jgi:hypothetical protein
MVRAEMLFFRARCALACASITGERQQYLGSARKLVRRLRKQRMAWCEPAADLVLAGLHCVEGRCEQSVEILRRAEEAFRESSTLALAEAARRQRGVLLGGSEGADLVAASDEWLRARSVANPERLTAFFAPGFSRSED